MSGLRILQFGATGQLAREMLARAGGYGVAIEALSRDRVDLTDAAAVARAVEAAQADLVLNAAAYTAVDRAESEPDLAFAVNGAAPEAMAKACAARGLPLVHISTDYVFDGQTQGAWRETDPTSPLGVYGRSKQAGEAAVLAAGGAALVVRTSWVFSPHGANFVKTMLRLATEGRPELAVVDDQSGRPTCAGDLADFILDAAPGVVSGEAPAGLLHFAGAGETTWRRFAETIFERADLARRPKVRPIATADYPTPARRPVRSVLDTTRLETHWRPPRDWREGLDETLTALGVRAAPALAQVQAGAA